MNPDFIPEGSALIGQFKMQKFPIKAGLLRNDDLYLALHGHRHAAERVVTCKYW